MPTVILIDVSLSMARPVSQQESPGEIITKRNLAVHGINALLDYLAVNSKLEFVALVAFSSLYEIVSNFTRDFEMLKSKLQQLEEFDKTCIESALRGVDKLVLAEWGSTPCQVVMIVDGNPGIGLDSLKHSLGTQPQRSQKNRFPLPFNFPGNLSIMCIADSTDPLLLAGLPLYQRLAELAGSDSAVYVPDGNLSAKSVQTMFRRLGENKFSAFHGMLQCGHLDSHVVLSPSPRPYTRVSDFETAKLCISDTIEVCGFMDIADVGSPAAISRHLILPFPLSKTEHPGEVKREAVDGEAEEEVGVDEGKTPSFCVLLHGALKVENMAALCLLQENWFGFVYSWADSKKKSNLMLTILEPGAYAVPWLGDLNRLGSKEEYVENNHIDLTTTVVPPRFQEKRSYSQSQNCVVWIRTAGIQSDLQKILRNARKLPDKTSQFYKELNRVRKAALSMGFDGLLDGMAAILERECTLLPGTSHPDCALQLTHAAGLLRKTHCRDYKANILPLHTTFMNND